MNGSADWISGWAKMPAWALVDRRLSDADRVTLAYVVARLFGEWFALSASEIGRHRGMHERTVREQLTKLCALGYLRRELVKAGGSMRYARGPALDAQPPGLEITPGPVDPGMAQRPGDGLEARTPRASRPGPPGPVGPPSEDEDQTKSRLEIVELALESPTPLRSTPKRAAKHAANSDPDVEAVFARWREKTGHPRAVLDAKRARVIRAALASHGRETCELAIEGLAASDWHMGRDPKTGGQRYDGIDHALGSAERIERHAAGARKLRPLASTERLTIDEERLHTEHRNACNRAGLPKLSKAEWIAAGKPGPETVQEVAHA